MPYILQSSLQSISSVLRKVLYTETAMLDADLKTMREIKLSPITRQLVPKDMKDRAWKAINKHKTKVQKVAELQAQLKRLIATD